MQAVNKIKFETKYEICPICELRHRKLVHSFHPSYEADIISTIKTSFPEWETKQGICGRCFDEFEAITYHPYRASGTSLEAYKLNHLNFYILPIAARLNADEFFTGEGVTICIIDSNFYLHPDFKDRVIKVIDITDCNNDIMYFEIIQANAEHATMTTAVCAGNGSLSSGLYKGIANKAKLVLIKTANEQGKITDKNISKALQWVKDNHKQYNIRITNLSIGGDVEESMDTSSINQLAEDLFKADVLVVAAVGNNLEGAIVPPASGLHVVAVGGLDDNNKLDGDIILYHSNYGITVDGFSKPDLISNAIFLPAPMLPGAPLQKKAKILFQSLENEDYMQAIIQNNAVLLKEEHISLFDGKEKIWKEVKKIFWKEKFITPHYIHVDGTSFAAPIVSSVAAQMLEANPLLTANEIRQVLLKTASPLPIYDTARQGHGRLHPKISVYAVMNEEDIQFKEDNPIVSRERKQITFYIHLPYAKLSVSLVASFNNWKTNEIVLKPAKSNVWYVTIPVLSNGRYEYKFFVDNDYWVEDVANPWRVVNKYGGWNNVFEIN